MEEIGSSDGLEVFEVGFDAGDCGLRECCLKGGNRRLTVVAGDDDLGQHRIVKRRHFRAPLDPAVDAGAFGEDHLGQKAGARTEIGMGHFRVDAGLDGSAFRD